MRRFLKSFQQSIGRIGIHLVSAVDDTDPPAALGTGTHLEEMWRPTRFFDGDLGAPALALVVPGPPQQQQVRIGLGFQQLADRVLRAGTERATLCHRCGAENPACGPPGEAGFADPRAAR